MNKAIGIGLIGIGMGQDLLYLNHDPESLFQEAPPPITTEPAYVPEEERPPTLQSH